MKKENYHTYRYYSTQLDRGSGYASRKQLDPDPEKINADLINDLVPVHRLRAYKTIFGLNVM